ncbi:hypothetical protein BpHYR1_034993 [Brachionus plicatilis]|uniref:Uncharacterized protein n=1 Tax=Brachionus plicatilis TaxID=10195 RepID=A0A3M7R8A6_BRAPC|nr:hypothetical protein BpHYR1_034993 [Brachionus plicatilis]
MKTCYVIYKFEKWLLKWKKNFHLKNLINFDIYLMEYLFTIGLFTTSYSCSLGLITFNKNYLQQLNCYLKKEAIFFANGQSTISAIKLGTNDHFSAGVKQANASKINIVCLISSMIAAISLRIAASHNESYKSKPPPKFEFMTTASNFPFPQSISNTCPQSCGLNFI